MKSHKQLFVAAGYQNIFTSIARKKEMAQVFLNPDGNNKKICPGIQIIMHPNKEFVIDNLWHQKLTNI